MQLVHAHLCLLVFRIFSMMFVSITDQSVVCPDPGVLVYGLCSRSYGELIEKTYNFASKRILQLLMEEKDLMGRLR